MTTWAIALVAGALAYANGANDVSKGVATLVGSGVTNDRRALLWGTVWTGVGGVLGAFFAEAMLKTFGSGLLAGGFAPTLAAGIAVLAGAAAWVLIATRTALPVSTTHALVGSLMGVGAVAYGVGAIQWDVLGTKVFLPLLLTPFFALAVVALVLRSTREQPPTSGDGPDDGGSGSGDSIVSASVVTAGAIDATALPAAPKVLAAAGLIMSRLHWLTSGATSLARGMNDAPKIVALALGAGALGASGQGGLSVTALFVIVTGAMILGSILGGLRVTRVLAEEVTPMDDREGFVANLVTAALVTTGAIHGLPMSTTHVASGGIFGAGAQRGSLDRGVLRKILAAWVITLPAAAALGIGAYGLATIFLT